MSESTVEERLAQLEASVAELQHQLATDDALFEQIVYPTIETLRDLTKQVTILNERLLVLENNDDVQLAKLKLQDRVFETLIDRLDKRVSNLEKTDRQSLLEIQRLKRLTQEHSLQLSGFKNIFGAHM